MSPNFSITTQFKFAVDSPISKLTLLRHFDLPRRGPQPFAEKGFIKTEVSPPQGIPIRIVTALSRGISAAGDTRHSTFCRKTNASKHFPAGMEVRA